MWTVEPFVMCRGIGRFQKRKWAYLFSRTKQQTCMAKTREDLEFSGIRENGREKVAFCGLFIVAPIVGETS